MQEAFSFGMKVSMSGEFGVVIETDGPTDWDREPGVIRWDTDKEHDQEDWRGLFGSFLQSGGAVIDQNHAFRYIDDAGKYQG